MGGKGGVSGGVGFFSYFPPLKPRYVLWSGTSYSLKNTVLVFCIRILAFIFEHIIVQEILVSTALV